MIDPITISGGVVADAELRFTQSGAAVTSFRIAQSDSKKNDQDQWETYQSLYLPVNIWNDNPQWKKNPIPWAEMAAALQKGDRVAVHGKLITRVWEAKDGTKRSQIEMQADSFFVMPPMPQQQPAGNGFGQQAQGGWGGQQQQQAPPQQHQGNTWGQPAPTGQATGGQDDSEPPF